MERPMIADVSLHREELQALCRRFHVRRLDVFGSAARGTDFDPSRSDLDFMVDFDNNALPTLNTYFDFKEALQQLFDRPVDLVERAAIETSRNYIRRRAILDEAQVVYG
jgi:predicted nucleotidyltransferase